MEHKSRLEEDMMPVRTDNKELQCGTCRYLMPENTIACEKYIKKPGYVLYGTKPCPQYKSKRGTRWFGGRELWKRK